MKKKLVFCLGTGRCGTSSFSFLVNSQQSSFFGHELSPILPWDFEDKVSHKRSAVAMSTVQFKFNQLMHQLHNYDIVGDAGSYYLPYVELLIRSQQFNRDFFDLKFVVLKRDKKETVQSFLEKFKRQNNNPLQNHDGPKNEWDEVFPKYETETLEEAVEKYYDDYYTTVSELVKKHPAFIRVFKTSDLNEEQTVKSIFEFLEIDNPLVLTGIKKNQTERI